MNLELNQIEELLTIISKNQLVVSGEYSTDFVTEEDKRVMLRFDVDFKKLYSTGQTVFNAFNFGMLAESLKAAESSKFNYSELLEFIKKGEYIPQSSQEKSTIEWFTNQPLKEVENYRLSDIIKSEILAGVKARKTAQQIASDIGHKTGNWGLEDIISYYQDAASLEAKIIEIKKRNSGHDSIVYKSVGKSGCCDHCVRLYLTNGKGSQPILFKLAELELNGSNEGKNSSEWKPTAQLTHKFCSCSLHEYSDGYLWNPESLSFSIPDPDYIKRVAAKRPLIRVWINGKEHYL